MPKLETAVSNMLMFFIAIIPMVVIPFFTDSIYYAKIFIVYCTTVIFILIYVRSLTQFIIKKPKVPMGVKMGLGYLICITLTLPFSEDLYQSIQGTTFRAEGYLALVMYVLLMCMAAFFYEFKPWHLWVLGFGTTIVSLVGILQFFGINLVPLDQIIWQSQGMVYSTIGNANFLGSYLTLMLPIFVFAFVKTKKWPLLIPCGAIYFCLLSSNTRGAWIGSAIAFGLLAFLIIKEKIHPKRLIIIMAIFMGLTILFGLFNPNFTGRFASVFTDFNKLNTGISQQKETEGQEQPGEVSNIGQLGSSRIYIWQKTWTLIKERPLTGYGIETMGTVMEERFAKENQAYFNGPMRVDKAHNEYLHISYSSGVIAALIYFLFQISVIVTGLKTIKNAKGTTQYLLSIPLVCSVVGYLFQALTNISIVSVAYIFWIFCGIIIVNRADNKA